MTTEFENDIWGYITKCRQLLAWALSEDENADLRHVVYPSYAAALSPAPKSTLSSPSTCSVSSTEPELQAKLSILKHLYHNVVMEVCDWMVYNQEYPHILIDTHDSFDTFAARIDAAIIDECRGTQRTWTRKGGKGVVTLTPAPLEPVLEVEPFTDSDAIPSPNSTIVPATPPPTPPHGLKHVHVKSCAGKTVVEYDDFPLQPHPDTVSLPDLPDVSAKLSLDVPVNLAVDVTVKPQAPPPPPEATAAKPLARVQRVPSPEPASATHTSSVAQPVVAASPAGQVAAKAAPKDATKASPKDATKASPKDAAKPSAPIVATTHEHEPVVLPPPAAMCMKLHDDDEEYIPKPKTRPQQRKLYPPTRTPPVTPTANGLSPNPTSTLSRRLSVPAVTVTPSSRPVSVVSTSATSHASDTSHSPTSTATAKSDTDVSPPVSAQPEPEVERAPVPRVSPPSPSESEVSQVIEPESKSEAPTSRAPSNPASSSSTTPTVRAPPPTSFPKPRPDSSDFDSASISSGRASVSESATSGPSTPAPTPPSKKFHLPRIPSHSDPDSPLSFHRRLPKEIHQSHPQPLAHALSHHPPSGSDSRDTRGRDRDRDRPDNTELGGTLRAHLADKDATADDKPRLRASSSSASLPHHWWKLGGRTRRASTHSQD